MPLQSNCLCFLFPPEGSPALWTSDEMVQKSCCSQCTHNSRQNWVKDDCGCPLRERSIRASTYVLATSAANHGAISTQVDASAARITIVHRTAVIFRIDRVPSRTGSAIPNLRSPRVSESPQPERCGICGQVCRSGYQEIFRALSPRNSPDRTPVSHRSCCPL